MNRQSKGPLVEKRNYSKYVNCIDILRTTEKQCTIFNQFALFVSKERVLYIYLISYYSVIVPLKEQINLYVTNSITSNMRPGWGTMALP